MKPPVATKRSFNIELVPALDRDSEINVAGRAARPETVKIHEVRLKAFSAARNMRCLVVAA